MKLALALYSIFFTSISWGYSSCGHLKEELKAMENAQKQVMQSLITNHETFASSLEEYSNAVRNADGSSKQMMVVKMNESAQAFRNRGIQGKRMAVKLNGATDDLIKRVLACIK
ncbi:MAG: hypothetical protein ACXVCP_05870 [Bdellovibrio sp.]